MAEIAGSAGRWGDDALLDAARDGILAVGWRRTTLTEVARRAGVSRMTIYRGWPDMQTLLSDLLTREMARVEATASAAAGAQRPDDPELADAIAAHAVSMVATLRADPLWRQIVEVDPELLLPYLLDRRGRSQQATLDRVAAVIEAGVAAGTLRAVEPRAGARTLLLAAHGFLLSSATMTGDGVEEADLDRELGELVRRYLAP